MLYQRVTGRAWAAVALAIAAYIGCGFGFEHNGTVEAWLYRLGLTGVALVAPVFVGIYTFIGLRNKRPPARWWRTRLGSVFVAAALAQVPAFAPLAWVFWFDGGVLTSSWLAWAAVAGPAVAALTWATACVLWLQVYVADSAMSASHADGGAEPSLSHDEG